VIVDTSVWVEYLRGTGSTAHETLRRAIERDADLVVPELVSMELTMGVTEEVAASVQSLLSTFEVASLAPLVDSVEAAGLYRECRRAGETIRSPIDCLIAATALRLDLPVLHRDRDFEVLRRHTGLTTVSTLD